MKDIRGKTIVAVFAHPDDETFGPGGTLLKLAQGNDVYIICITNGDMKMGDRRKEISLGKIRKKELVSSATILGIKKIFFLGYRDGNLNNNLYHEIADKVKNILEYLHPDMLLTYDGKGVSGHTDHIVVSNVTSFLFHKMKTIQRLWYYCMSQRNHEQQEDYFIFMPKGYEDHEISHIIDVSDVWDQKVRAMHCHVSQMHDVERILRVHSKVPKSEYFIEVTNS